MHDQFLANAWDDQSNANENQNQGSNKHRIGICQPQLKLILSVNFHLIDTEFINFMLYYQYVQTRKTCTQHA